MYANYIDRFVMTAAFENPPIGRALPRSGSIKLNPLHEVIAEHMLLKST